MPPDIKENAKIAEIVSRLVASVDPDRIILFGSRARGGANTSSDFDILIVKSSSESRYSCLRRARASLFGVGASVDLLWYTPEELEEWSGVRGHVAAEALREGVVVYDRKVEPGVPDSQSESHPFRLKTITTSGEGLVCEADWDTIRAAIYDGHGG